MLDPAGEDEPELGGEHRTNGRRWALAHRLAPDDRQAVVDGYRAGATAQELAERAAVGCAPASSRSGKPGGAG